MCVCACVTCNSNWFYLQKKSYWKSLKRCDSFFEAKGLQGPFGSQICWQGCGGKGATVTGHSAKHWFGSLEVQSETGESDAWNWPNMSTNPSPKHFRSEKGHHKIMQISKGKDSIRCCGKYQTFTFQKHILKTTQLVILFFPHLPLHFLHQYTTPTPKKIT